MGWTIPAAGSPDVVVAFYSGGTRRSIHNPAPVADLCAREPGLVGRRESQPARNEAPRATLRERTIVPVQSFFHGSKPPGSCVPEYFNNSTAFLSRQRHRRRIVQGPEGVRIEMQRRSYSIVCTHFSIPTFPCTGKVVWSVLYTLAASWSATAHKLSDGTEDGRMEAFLGDRGLKSRCSWRQGVSLPSELRRLEPRTIPKRAKCPPCWTDPHCLSGAISALKNL